MSNSPRIAYVLTLLITAIFCRWIPHPPNFTPVLAIAMFGGAAFGNRWLAFGIPLLVMFVSDLILGLHAGIPVIYATLIGIVFLGRWVRRKQSVLRVASGALTASVAFFVITNFAVWAGGALYPFTPAGLMACYVAAIPFFANTLASTFLFSTLLFGSLALGEKRLPSLRPATA